MSTSYAGGGGGRGGNNPQKRKGGNERNSGRAKKGKYAPLQFLYNVDDKPVAAGEADNAAIRAISDHRHLMDPARKPVGGWNGQDIIAVANALVGKRVNVDMTNAVDAFMSGFLNRVDAEVDNNPAFKVLMDPPTLVIKCLPDQANNGANAIAPNGYFEYPDWNVGRYRRTAIIQPLAVGGAVAPVIPDALAAVETNIPLQWQDLVERAHEQVLFAQLGTPFGTGPAIGAPGARVNYLHDARDPFSFQFSNSNDRDVFLAVLGGNFITRFNAVELKGFSYSQFGTTTTCARFRL